MITIMIMIITMIYMYIHIYIYMYNDIQQYNVSQHNVSNKA